MPRSHIINANIIAISFLCFSYKSEFFCGEGGGVLKLGHRCARIDDLVSDVYSAIEYTYVMKKNRVELLRPLRAYAQNANVINKPAELRLLPCRHTQTHTHRHTCKQRRIRSCTNLLMHLWALCTHNLKHIKTYFVSVA